MAGTENAYRMVGYMDGAVEAGERIARNVLVSLGRLPPSQYDVVSSPAPSPQLPFVDMELSFVETHAPSVPQVVGALVALMGCAAYLVMNKKRQ